MRKIISLCLTCNVLVFSKSPMENSVDSMLTLAMSANASPGMSVAVVSDNKIVYAKGFGVTDFKSNQPVNQKTPFYIASTTKSFTAMAVLMGAMQNKWSLDMPVEKYLPELAGSIDTKNLTLRQLITHAHCIAGDQPLTIRTAYSGEIDPDGMQRALAALKPSAGGKVFEYSNTGYILAGIVMERITGKSWKELVNEMVLNPCGMNSTRSSVQGLDVNSFAQPHALDSITFTQLSYTKTDITMHAAGGHISTAADLARWLILHLNQGRIDGKQILPKEIIEQSHVIQVPQDKKFGAIRRFGWSPGWDIGVLNGDTLVHRFGSFAGFRSHVSFMPSQKIGVVVLVNESGAGGQLADMTAAYLYDAYRNKPVEKYRPQFEEFSKQVALGRVKTAEEKRKRAARGQEPLAHELTAYTGTFVNPAAGTLIFKIIDGRLACSMGLAADYPEIYKASADQWRVELTGSGKVVTFKFTNGMAASVEFEGMIFDRVK
jgi:CubicO group peptidase (beta-lactamase class C family)